MRKQGRLRKRLIMTYIVLAMIPLVVLGGLSYSVTCKNAKMRMDALMENSMLQLRATLETRLTQHARFIYYISLNEQLRTLLFSDIMTDYAKYYMTARSVDPLLLQYYVLNADEILDLSVYSRVWKAGIGQYVKPLPPGAAPTGERDTQWAMEGGALIARQPIFSNQSNAWLGYLQVTFDADAIFRGMDAIDEVPCDLTITLENGQTAFARTRLEDGAGAGKIALDVPTLRGRMTCAYAGRDGMGDNAGLPLLLIGACMLLSVTLIGAFSGQILKKLEELTRKVRAPDVALSAQAFATTDTDEVGVLSSSIGGMIETIQTLNGEILKSRLDEQEARLRLLQAQINPHFLYNALSVINWCAIENGDARTGEMTRLLATFYRTTLNRGKNMLRVSQEIENIKAYLQIQRIMHDDGFEVRYALDEEILSLWMLNFLLQPIVENAVKYGVDRREAGGGALEVRGFLRDGALVFCIRDNGEGFETTQIAESGGYGLMNIEKRVRFAHGDAYGLTLENDGGAVVTLRLPILPNAPDGEE